MPESVPWMVAAEAMRKIELELDGRVVLADEGKTLLEVAADNGIEIPTHCYHPGYPPAGRCRLCLVEVQPPDGKPELKAACTYPAQEKLVVRTDSERVLRARRMTAELLLARCPGSKAVREIAERLGVKETRFSHKNLDCTLCGLCTRACEAVNGKSVITYSGRGPDCEIVSPFELSPEECKGCGSCAAVCPTGAIEMIEMEER